MLAEAMLWKISDETFRDDVAPQDYDLKQLRLFLKSQRNKRVLFLGYDQMASAHYRNEDLKAASSAAMKAWMSPPRITGLATPLSRTASSSRSRAAG